MTATALERDTALDLLTTDDPGHASHIVYVPDELNTTPQALVLAARIEGFPVEALCGYTWIPFRDPVAYPVCEKCVEAYRNFPNATDPHDRERMPDA